MKVYLSKLLVMAMLAVSSVVMGAGNDALIMFSTRGPDRYADGSSVQEGECYALVWVRDGFDFAGIDLNGKAVDTNNNEVVVALSLAKAGKRGGVSCPRTLFQIDEEFATEHADGTFALVLLDTRVANAAGELVASGNPNQVNGWGFVEKSRVRAIRSQLVSAKADEAGDEGVTTGNASALPADENIPQPKITGITVQNGYVVLTVKGTSPRLIYNVMAGATPGNLNTRNAGCPAQGHKFRDREIKLVVPADGKNKFFKVVRHK